jgi:phospholipid/cholesterol/gamma-HCH transport system permease protein
VWAHWHNLVGVSAVVGAVLLASLTRKAWSKGQRALLLRQLSLMAVEPLFFVCAVATLVGGTVLVQVSYWVGETGQSQMLGPLTVTIIARELAPVLINFIVIVRSGSAMATELGVQKLNGGFAEMEASGIDPFFEIAAPRVLGMAISTLCLTFVFTIVALISGFAVAAFLGIGSSNIFLFADSMSRAIQLHEVFNILAKSVLPALFAAACCCIGGLGVAGSVGALPLATQRALTRSIAGLFIICSAVSVLHYL